MNELITPRPSALLEVIRFDHSLFEICNSFSQLAINVLVGSVTVYEETVTSCVCMVIFLSFYFYYVKC